MDYIYLEQDKLTICILAGKLKVGNNESGWIDINDANTRLLEGSNNALRMQTNSGYVE
jgi:hypothetical protein